MSETTKPTDPRAERLKAALRDNLRRRKAQIRERNRVDAPEAPRDPDGDPAPASAPDSDVPG